ncbi:MAG: pilin [Candidatus Saccharimonadales bacterium]
MLQKIETLIVSLSLLFLPAAPLAVVGVASAQDEIQGNLCKGADKLVLDPVTGAQSCASQIVGKSDLNSFITKVVNIISIIVGVVAVIMIIVGGFRYIASGGKAESVQGAKNTILYALIGLVIVALSQIIVRFVLKQTISA